jgi:hypothetical protein
VTTLTFSVFHDPDDGWTATVSNSFKHTFLTGFGGTPIEALTDLLTAIEDAP